MNTPIDAPRRRSADDVKHMTIGMRLSLTIGFLMLAMKFYAYYLTGSAAILSDAAESIVHVFAVSFAYYSFRLSLKPADPEHMYGHDRISFFSAGVEGAMIVLAAVYIVFESITKWMAGLTLENLGAGTLFTVAAVVVNGALGWYLVRLGKRYHSILLEADGKHVLTDSWTSLGVVVALILIQLTGWLPFDPILAILVALNILWSGGKLVRRSIGGLMDEADPAIDAAIRRTLIEQSTKYGIQFHNVRHRNAGNRLLIEFHLLFPRKLPIARAHEIATTIESELHRALPTETEILSHLEPIEGHDEVHERILGSSAP
jgi:cation diffusion facilitator family transporter